MSGRSAALLLALCPLVAAQDSRPETDLLRRDVAWLCAPERAGRGSAAAREAVAGWIAGRFAEAGLQPLFGDGWRQRFRVLHFAGTNVGAVLPGSGWPEDRRHVVLSAHYDHLGLRGGRLHPGAADNAAGVAALLQVLRGLRSRAERLRRSVVLLAFDQEEQGLWGSRFYARHPPVPLDHMDAFVTLDILGRRVLGVQDDALVVVGCEHGPGLVDLVAAVRRAADPRLFWVGSDVVGDRSDFAAFRNRDVPFLFFTTGENRDYHRPTDTPGRLDLELLARQADLVRRVVARLAGDRRAPRFRKEPVTVPEEARSLRALVSAAARAAPAAVRPRIEELRAALERVLAAEGAVDRTMLRSIARHVLLSLRAR